MINKISDQILFIKQEQVVDWLSNSIIKSNIIYDIYNIKFLLYQCF